MIKLLDAPTSTGEVSVTMRRADGAVGYLKGEVLQTMVDARGRNLAAHVDAAVDVLLQEAASRILVLGFGGGAASTLLHQAGASVVSVDRDPCAKPLAELFFRAPPCLEVVVSDAAAYVARAMAASFDGMFIDFQESSATPEAYLSASFWRAVSRVLKPGCMMVVNLTDWLYEGRDWADFRRALGQGGFDAVALSHEYGDGNRILVSSTLSQSVSELVS
ncbi:MAG: methyltransferase domain-containing protein [Pseudomonadota bacterium]|uniref:methyltransferase domain-containing protein n=1 Tax=Phenylobacterium sp. TaxID=1871053 RepID=UPI00260129BB|nr:methyltransferase domain-containing protein [Phenylobacterium sp.]MBT9471959.1 methyltransferase domain-containing protein [Phenylobacterium sp.]